MMSDEIEGRRRRSEILRQRAERRAYNQPRIPWYAKVWNWFLPGTYQGKDARRNRGIVVGAIAMVLALLGVISYNIHQRMVSEHVRIVVADGVFASGQEANIIEDFESQGFRDTEYEEGLGVVAYGTEEMVSQYCESFGDQYLDEATERLSGTHDGIGIVSFLHSEGWDVISISTYTDTPDVDLFQYMLTTEANITNALDEWIAWGVMQNGKPIKVEFLDGTGSRYFEVDGISSVADILTETKNSNPKGIDWESVTEDINNNAQGSTEEETSQDGEGK